MAFSSKAGRFLSTLSSHRMSWAKYKYMQLLCSKSLSLSTIKNVSSDPKKDFEIQPNLKDSVSSTLKNKSTTEKLHVPQYLNETYTLAEQTFPDIGQPTPYTHPHMFTSIEHATPGISHAEYKVRRRNLMILLSNSYNGKQYNDHVVIVPANSAKIMSNDIPYPFHQNNDFLYLTGINEPDAVLVMSYNASSKQLQCIVFVKPKDPHKELWDGPLVGVALAKKYFKFDEARPLSSLSTTLKDKYGTGDHLIWMNNLDGENSTKISKIVTPTSFHKKGLFTIGHNLQMLRLIKSDAEIEVMKQSASIACKAFAEVMKNTKPGLTESHLHALLEFECRLNGAQRLSFPPVVAGGNRANTLHYVNNTHILSSGDLVLMDGGCEFNGYASDITRTWPVNGRFTEEQKLIYNIVLSVQKICLDACRPGVSMDQLHHIMLISLGEKLQEIGFIKPHQKEDQLKREVQRFCPHHLGHYLGMDTHDTPLLHRRLPLQPGMVFTLEPGVYIPKTMTDLPHKYHGIGIRVEDDILMTENGPFVLTGELPKEVEDIETLMEVS